MSYSSKFVLNLLLILSLSFSSGCVLQKPKDGKDFHYSFVGDVVELYGGPYLFALGFISIILFPFHSEETIKSHNETYRYGEFVYWLAILPGANLGTEKSYAEFFGFENKDQKEEGEDSS